MERAARFAWTVALTSCADGQSPREHPQSCAVSAIYGGLDAAPLGMTALEVSAIVSVEQVHGSFACTGVLIDERTVLTAAHCTTGHASELVVRIEPEGSPPTTLLVLEIEVPGVADLALLRLDPEAVRNEEITPIPVAGAALPARRDGQLAVMTGFGVTESLEYGRRRFAFATIEEATDEWITTRATGTSGACIGDSGGPLLWRDENGLLKVYGVLSSGDASCRGEDYFVNVTGAPWAAESSSNPGCEDLGSSGECFGSTVAVRCDAGTLVTESCENGTTCGWDASEGRYGCLDSTSSGCEGFDSWGACRGNRAIRCQQGELISARCDCGGCQRSSLTGRVDCYP